MKNLIEIKNLTKIYGKGLQKVLALKDIDLKVVKGDFLAIMGPSGSGKTTLLNILGCLDRPTSGSYKLEGEEITKLTKDRGLAKIRNQKFGFIFQTFNLLPRASALSNVILPLLYSQKKSKVKKEGAKQDRAKEMLEKVGLIQRTSHKPNQLSGGEQQRIAIARALINNPEILLADEPTGNLDKNSEKEIMDILKKLNEEGLTLILVTHDPQIAKVAFRTIKLEHGEIKE